MSWRNAVAVGLSLFLAQAQLSLAQTTYRWLDQDGRIIYSDQPPPPNARKAEAKKLGAANSIATSGPDYETRLAAQAAPVTLFTSGDCIAECQSARDFLQQNGIPYGERPLKSAADSAAYKSATGSEALLVPTLVAGSMVHQGFENGAWSQLLGVAGYTLRGSGASTPSR